MAVELPVKQIEWLHLSDFHFTTNSEQTRDRVLKALLVDLEERLEAGVCKPDFVVVTGDIAFSGKPEEFNHAWNYLQQILKICDLKKDRLFVVPGNHDVIRAEHRPALLKALREANTAQEYSTVCADLGAQQVQKLLFRRLSAYMEFVRKLPKRRLISEDKLWFVDTVTGAGGATAAIAGLTSAWASGEDLEDERKYLAVGEFQARPATEALRKTSADIRIVMLHHPMDSLQREDERSLVRDLRGACDVMLRGHLHHTDLSVSVDPDWRFATLAAGSAFETRWTKNGYLLVRASIHNSDLSLVVHARRWAIDGDFFAADTTTYSQGRNNGVFELKLSKATA